MTASLPVARSTTSPTLDCPICGAAVDPKDWAYHRTTVCADLAAWTAAYRRHDHEWPFAESSYHEALGHAEFQALVAGARRLPRAEVVAAARRVLADARLADPARILQMLTTALDRPGPR